MICEYDISLLLEFNVVFFFSCKPLENFLCLFFSWFHTDSSQVRLGRDLNYQPREWASWPAYWASRFELGTFHRSEPCFSLSWPLQTLHYFKGVIKIFVWVLSATTVIYSVQLTNISKCYVFLLMIFLLISTILPKIPYIWWMGSIFKSYTSHCIESVIWAADFIHTVNDMDF